MKNIQIIDGARNCVYDIFAAAEEDFALLFPNGTNVAFIEEIYSNSPIDVSKLDELFKRIWLKPIKKSDAYGINGIIFYEMDYKKLYYPTRKDEEAINPDGSSLR